MANRDKRTISSDEFTPEEARYILEGLVSDRRVSRIELRQYRQRMQEEARDLLERLRSLGWQGAVTGAAVAAAGVVAASPSARAAVGRAVRKVSPAMAAGRKLQGRYLGLIRQIPEAQRPRYSKIAKEESREAAIKAMQEALGKSTPAGGRKRGRKRARKSAKASR